MYQKLNQTYQDAILKKPFLFHLCCLSLAAFLAIVFYHSLKRQYFFFYSVNDDLFIRSMLNGELYAGSGYSIMIKKWLGTVFAFLYRWRPYTEWYALCMWSCILTSLTLCFHAFLSQAKSILHLCSFFSFFLIVCLCFSEHFLVTTYTEVAALLMLSASLTAYNALSLYCIHFHKTLLWGFFFISIGLAALSFSLRSDSCFMILPFAGILFIEALLKTDRTCRRYCFFYAVLLIFILAVIWGHNRLAYVAVDDYQTVLPYAAATNPLYNYYDIPDYTSHQTIYDTIGMSRRTWQFFQARSYVFAQDFHVDQIAALGQYAAETAPFVSFSQWFSTLGRSFLFTNFFPLGPMTAVSAALSFFVSYTNKEHRFLLLQAGTLIAYSTAALYLSYHGRLPDRVIIPLYLALFILSLYLLFSSLASAHKKLSLTVCGLFMALFLCFQDTVNTNIHDSQGLQLTFFRRQETVFHYIASHPANFYIVAPTLSPSGGAFTYNKTQRSSNFIYFADYTTYLPEWKRKLAEYDIDPSSLLDEFIEKEQVLLLSPSDTLVHLIQEYLAERYPEKELILIDILCDGYYPVYNVSDR